MARAKADRDDKRQMGQFLTPDTLAAALVEDLPLFHGATVLEPGFGGGAFLVLLLNRLMSLDTGAASHRAATVLSRQLHGVEMDVDMYVKTLAVINIAILLSRLHCSSTSTSSVTNHHQP